MKNIIFIFLLAFLSSCRDNPNKQSEVQSEVTANEKLVKPASLDELYVELKSRIDSKSAPLQEDTIPPYFTINEKFSSYSNYQLFNLINDKQIKISEILYGPPPYGPDNREDLIMIKDPKIIENGLATCCIVSTSNISTTDNTIFSLNCAPTGYCPDEPFSNQKKLANCTAFAIASDIILTAGHCINDRNYKNFMILYDFNILGHDQNVKTSVNKNSVYKIVDFLDQGVLKGIDFAVLKIDRPVPKNMILSIRSTGKVPDNSKLYVAGYPDGLPLKIATNGEIRDNQNSMFFVTNLDTYKGNSGSPVFDSLSHKVEGILVRGEQDFIQLGNCKRSFHCGNKDCRGEDVIRITELLPVIGKYLPK